MPPQSVKPASEQTASAVSGGGAGFNLEEEKLQAVKENLMGSLEGEVEDNLDDIDKDDLDEFLMNKEEEVDVSRDRELTREGSGNKHPDFDPTKKFGNTGKKRLKAGTIAPGLVIVSYTYGIM